MIALIVDDSATQRHVQRKALEALGWQVHAAVDGEQALTQLRGLPHCDLLLTDWHMPGMDGLQLVSTIRQEQRFAGLRIIMVTSDSVLDAVDKSLAAGANDFLMKPFTPEAFAERISAVMDA